MHHYWHYEDYSRVHINSINIPDSVNVDLPSFQYDVPSKIRGSFFDSPPQDLSGKSATSLSALEERKFIYFRSDCILNALLRLGFAKMDDSGKFWITYRDYFDMDVDLPCSCRRD